MAMPPVNGNVPGSDRDLKLGQLGKNQINSVGKRKVSMSKPIERKAAAQDSTGAGSTHAGWGLNQLFSDIAQKTSREAGRAWVFVLAFGTIVVWGITGPLFGFSDTWQLVINTGTTIVTFLMVFLIQNSQNRDATAIQIKLDELIRASKAHNSFVGVEHLTDEDLEEIRTTCEERAKANLARRTASNRPASKRPGTKDQN
jgi:low affinity Fe/Cu permease